MYCTKESVDRVERRGCIGGKCAVCGAQVKLTGNYRPVWFDGKQGGGGDCPIVSIAYCPNCDERPELPLFGEHIFESELVTVATS